LDNASKLYLHKYNVQKKIKNTDSSSLDFSSLD